jgi:hypothetical protein
VALPGEVVSAGALSCVASPAPDFGLAPDAPEGLRRARLAEWIASPENPLTARVIVNRLWHYRFGKGIAGSPSDLGRQGERPTHPELLDWLACELIARGWSLKAMHRLMLESATYRQSAAWNEEAGRADGDCRLLWRFPSRRLEAEAVRDELLAASGLLSLQAGGPSFRPFSVSVFGSNVYTVEDRGGPALDRRSVYRMAVQSGRDPLLECLDGPDPSTKTPARATTTTPVQALSLMNGPFVERASRAFARRVESEAPTGPEAQVERAYRLALGRAPRPGELTRAAAHVREHGLEALAWVLFNSSEALYLP